MTTGKNTTQPRATDMAVTLTEAAARHVSRYLAKRGKGVGVLLKQLFRYLI